MADRTVVVRLRAEVNDFKRGMRESAGEVDKFTKSTNKTTLESKTAFGKMAESAQKNSAEWQTAGVAVTGAGAAITAVLVGSTKAAIDWEAAFTGVRKTVEGTPEQLAAIEEGLRGMARELPVSHAELAAVAEAAGQLGVQTDSILDFTRTMVDLGQTTNLTADEAATSIAQLMNVMQSAPDDVDNLGAALVALGNNGASTERDIIQMAQRIAGAGQIVGLAEDQVLAIANALASVGVEVEAGGSSISKVLTDMAKAVSTGSDDLGEFAKVAGVSAEDFTAAWESDPAEALTMFIEGLGRLNESGGDVFTTLDNLGQSDVRVSRALLGMAGAGDLLRDSLKLGNEAWEENTALTDEAAKRYDTTAAQLSTMKNQFVDAGISIGQTFLPVLGEMAEFLGTVADVLGGMPGPIQAVVGVILALAAATLLAAGGFLLLAPRIIATRAALATIPVAAGRATTALKLLGKAGVFMVALSAAVGVIEALGNAMAEAGPDADQLRRDLVNLSEDSGLVGLTGELDDLGVSIARLSRPSSGDQWKNVLPTTGFGEEARAEIESLDVALTSLVESGSADVAAESLEHLIATLGLAPNDAEWLKTDGLDGYNNALAEVDTNAQLAVGGIELVGLSAEDSAKVIDELKQRMEDLNNAFADDRSQIAFEQGLDDLEEMFTDLTKAAEGETAAEAKVRKEHLKGARALDVRTQAGRDAKSLILDQIATAEEHAQNVLEETNSVEAYNDEIRRQRKAILDAAEAKGIDKKKVQELVAELKEMPKDTTANVDVNTSAAKAHLDALYKKWNNRSITLRIHGDGAITYGAPGGRQLRASGGLMTGPGGPTDDLIPSMLSNGEYVIKASSVDKYGTPFLDAINAARFASGGAVGYHPPAMSNGSTRVMGASSGDLATAVERGMASALARGVAVDMDPAGFARLVAKGNKRLERLRP